MGLIGIRIRIALKDRVIPEFQMENNGVKDEPVKDEKIESDAKTIARTET